MIETEITKCEFCGREMRKATADNLNGLVWLLPYEKCVCPRCEKLEINKIIHA